mmetsp:Transcript_59187/g.121256  ORF Transcript_59187/g.121256 Transcript_59187/m.121256 type:complete len:119 (+) Transcript_59187:5-361(+)
MLTEEAAQAHFIRTTEQARDEGLRFGPITVDILSCYFDAFIEKHWPDAPQCAKLPPSIFVHEFLKDLPEDKIPRAVSEGLRLALFHLEQEAGRQGEPTPLLIYAENCLREQQDSAARR